MVSKKINIGRLVSFNDFEFFAKKNLKREVFDFIQEGAGEELTVFNNLSSFRKYQIIPRMLKGIEDVNIETIIFGKLMPTPLCLAPVSGQSLFEKGGEISSALAASKLNIPFILSTVSSFSIEEIAKIMKNGLRFFQLYLYENQDINRDLVKRAQASGYSGIVLTVDGPVIGKRLRSSRNKTNFNEFTYGNIKKYFPDIKNGELTSEDIAKNFILKKGLSWDDVDELRKWTDLPIILKGILNPIDAKIAEEKKLNGLIVSNHGGRQLDGAISSLNSLRLISEAIDGRIPLSLDGGVRNGSDIIKAMALGATNVLVGRFYVYALSLFGEIGVEKALNLLISDLKIAMINSGLASLSDVEKSMLYEESNIHGYNL